MTKNELEKKSIIYRKDILKYIYHGKAGHTGGSLSCIDILNVLYNDVMDITPENFSSNNRDHYIQSKGHSVEALYVVLADKGFFAKEELETLNSFKSHFIGHPTRKVNGIEQNTGALGHGLPMAAGVALAGKMDQKDYKVYTLLGDGELAEGSNWEAALFSAQYKLDNLCAIIDKNTLQITAPTAKVMNTDPLNEKWESFGWAVKEVDGNNVAALSDLLKEMPFEKDKPNLIIANTVKGKGVSYMENVLKWHHRVPTEEEYQEAIERLDNQLTQY